jgi:mycobactin polyketide synthetase MbtD
MDPEQAVSVSLHDHRSDPVVLAADPERIRVFFGAGTPEPATGVPAVEDSRAAETPDAVRSQLADVLDVDAATLDLDSSLFDLGVDSLLALDLRKRLKRLTGRTVPLATLLGGITGTDLITEISNESGFVA